MRARFFVFKAKISEMQKLGQRKINQILAGLMFLGVFFLFSIELVNYIAAKENELEGIVLSATHVKKEKMNKKIVDISKIIARDKKEAYVKDELIIGYKKSRQEKTSPEALEMREDFRASENINDKQSLLALKSGYDLKQEMKKLSSDPGVSFVQPNFQYAENQIDTNDPLRGELWGLENDGQSLNGKRGKTGADIKAPQAWKASGDGEEVVVAVIDSGVAFEHPDLRMNMWDGSKCVDWEGKYLGGCHHGYDFADNDKIPLPDESAHGTLVAGVIGAGRNNGKGVAGVSPQVKIMALKTDYTTGEIVKAIEFAEKNGAKIINASWGAGVDSCEALFDRSLYEEIKNFPGLVVAAAGNNAKNHDGKSHFFYPADFSHSSACWGGLSNVVSVAATDQKDELASFSDYGKFVDIGAPGENIVTTYVKISNPGTDEDGSAETYASASGTSLAAPHVAGLAALIVSEDKNIGAGELRDGILRSGESVPGLLDKIPDGKRADAFQGLALFVPDIALKAGDLGNLRLLGGSPESTSSRIAAIRLENPDAAAYFRLSKNKKKLKKTKWRAMPGELLVRVMKKKQRYYVQFRDGNGKMSPVLGKTFILVKS